MFVTTRRSVLLAGLVAPFALAERPHAPKDAHPPAPSADAVMRELTAGNKRFFSGHARHPHASLKRLKETAPAQHPSAVILSCADSRVCPEVLFDQGIGDIFTVRVAGNVANNDEVASVEYALEHFGCPVVVVLGHTECGAVKAVVNGDHEPASIQRLVQHIGEAVQKTRRKNPSLQGKELVSEAVRENVHESVEDMLRSSELIAEKVRSGALRIARGVYHLDDGKVEWLRDR